jgi:hypothetical protein
MLRRFLPGCPSQGVSIERDRLQPVCVTPVACQVEKLETVSADPLAGGPDTGAGVPPVLLPSACSARMSQRGCRPATS